MDQTIFILLFNYFVIKTEMSNESLICIGMLSVHTLGECKFVIAENNINVINNVLKLSVHSLIILINLFNFKLTHCFPLGRACLEFMSQSSELRVKIIIEKKWRKNKSSFSNLKNH